MFVAGEDAPITPVADMEEIGAAMRPDLVRLERFADAGHGVYRDRPGELFRVLRDFIAA
jgi:pimeloyl-ACP methyl ester carboxylesterase